MTLPMRESASISAGRAVAGKPNQDAASPSPAASAASSAPDATRSSGRSATLPGVTTKVITGHGPMYVTLNDDEFGSRECFVVLGKPGGTAAFSDALGRMISLAMTHGASSQEVIHQLRGIQDGHPYGLGPNAVLSVPDGVAQAMGEHYLSAGGGDESVESELPVVGACPYCGSGLARESGCVVCKSRGCGFSRRP